MPSLIFSILFSLNAILNFEKVKILLIWKVTDYQQTEQLIRWSSHNSVLTNHVLMHFTTLSIWQYSVNLAINNIFTPSKIRIVFERKQYGKHWRKHSLNFEIFRGFCNSHKHAKNSIFCIYIYTTKKFTEKVYISVHFPMILDHQKPGSIPSVVLNNSHISEGPPNLTSAFESFKSRDPNRQCGWP